MLTSVTSWTGNGLKDWLLQRVTAIYLSVYALSLLAYLICHHPISYGFWHNFFQCTALRVTTGIAIFMFVVHAWIGIWTVTTDYLKGTALRLIVQGLVALTLGIQLIWGFIIVWGS